MLFPHCFLELRNGIPSDNVGALQCSFKNAVSRNPLHLVAAFAAVIASVIMFCR